MDTFAKKQPLLRSKTAKTTLLTPRFWHLRNVSKSGGFRQFGMLGRWLYSKEAWWTCPAAECTAGHSDTGSRGCSGTRGGGVWRSRSISVPPPWYGSGHPPPPCPHCDPTVAQSDLPVAQSDLPVAQSDLICLILPHFLVNLAHFLVNLAHFLVNLAHFLTTFLHFLHFSGRPHFDTFCKIREMTLFRHFFDKFWIKRFSNPIQTQRVWHFWPKQWFSWKRVVFSQKVQFC